MPKWYYNIWLNFLAALQALGFESYDIADWQITASTYVIKTYHAEGFAARLHLATADLLFGGWKPRITPCWIQVSWCHCKHNYEKKRKIMLALEHTSTESINSFESRACYYAFRLAPELLFLWICDWIFATAVANSHLPVKLLQPNIIPYGKQVCV